MTVKQRRARLTTTARRDLKRQADYFRKRNKSDVAPFIQDLVAKIYQLAETGVTGSSRPFLPAHVRAFPYRNRCFYFTVDNGTLTVVRVLHSAQDVTEIIFDPPGDA